MFPAFKKANVPLDVDGTVFIPEIFKQSGIFILRNVIPPVEILALQTKWEILCKELEKKGGRRKDQNNPVNFLDELPVYFQDFWKSEYVKTIATTVIGPNVALYNHRIVIKDKMSDSSVFLHQDYCYHLGFPAKCSLFIPIFDSGSEQGSLSFYPGTHQYGYLGDAGEIDPKSFKKWERITPYLAAGDVAIMNSCLWHESGPNMTGTDRVLFDIIIQPADDPSGKDLVAGEWQTDFWINKDTRNYEIDRLFINSRTKKLKAFYSKGR